MDSKPAPLLYVAPAQPAVPPGLRISAFIDYLKLVLRFKKELQRSSVTKHLPEEWGAFTDVNIAAHIPGAKRSSPNTCDCYTLTIHEPHKHLISIMQLRFFLSDAGATLDEDVSTIEWGVDIYPTNEAPLTLSELAQLGEDITRCLNIQGIDLKLTPSIATAYGKSGNERSTNMANDVAKGRTVYIGEQPQWKVSKHEYRWMDCIGFKCYYKVTDRRQVLPASEHRLRLEFTASATHCPVSIIDLLLDSKTAKQTLSQYFHLDLQTTGLLYKIQHFLRAQHAAMPESTIAKARELHKRPLEIHCSECSVKYHEDDAIRIGRSRSRNADSKWNDRIAKAFERLTTGYDYEPLE